MRRADDLALRCQNWFWYWRVREISRLSNDELDVRCFGDVARKRHFERIQQSGSSPDEIPIRDGKKLLSIVDGWDTTDGSCGPFASATQAFRSRLWEFLTIRELSSREYTNFIQAYVVEQGWHRVQAKDVGLYKIFLGDSEPAVEFGLSTAYSAMLHKLANAATPDSLAILIALFREAIHAVFLQEATAIKSAISGAIIWMCQKYAMPDHVTRLLLRLVKDRILSNVWITEDDWRRHTSTEHGKTLGSRARIKELHAWVAWYTDTFPTLALPSYGQFPIVPRSPGIDWLESNRDSLELAQRRMDDQWQFRELRKQWLPAELQNAMPGDPLEPDVVARDLGRPSGEPIRFFSERPYLEIGSLPRAY